MNCPNPKQSNFQLYCLLPNNFCGQDTAIIKINFGILKITMNCAWLSRRTKNNYLICNSNLQLHRSHQLLLQQRQRNHLSQGHRTFWFFTKIFWSLGHDSNHLLQWVWPKKYFYRLTIFIRVKLIIGIKYELTWKFQDHPEPQPYFEVIIPSLIAWTFVENYLTRIRLHFLPKMSPAEQRKPELLETNYYWPDPARIVISSGYVIAIYRLVVVAASYVY